MKPKTGRERIITALHSGDATGVPWAPFIGPYFLRSLSQEEMRLFGLDDAFSGSAQELMKLKTAIPRWLRADVWAKQNAHKRGVEAKTTVKTVDNRRITTYHTPYGDLEDVRVLTDTTSYRAELPVKEKSDLRALRYILESSYAEPNYADFHALVDETGDDGVIYEPLDPPPVAVMFRWMKSEMVIYGLCDNDPELVGVMEDYHRRNLGFYGTAVKGPAEVFVPGCSYLTTQLISPDLFARYVVPHVEEYASLVHDGGKLLFLHMCGEIRELLPMVADAGIDGVDSVTPQPVGNVNLQDARASLRDDFTLIGGLDAETLHHGTAAEIESQVRRSVGVGDPAGDAEAPGRSLRGIVLQTADVISYGTPPANLMTVTRTLEELGLR